MEVDWHWPELAKVYFNKKKKINYKKKEGNYYEKIRIWWTICTTRIKRKIK